MIKIIIAFFVAVVALFTYWCDREQNEFTGENQHVNITKEQEVALGVQAVPEMASQFGGLSQSPEANAWVDKIGEELINNSVKNSGYKFDFHVLADPKTINAFALPGGQIFITEGLLNLLGTDGKLAGVLSHEIGHVLARHGAEHIAKAQLTEGLTGAAVIATYDPENPSTRSTAAIAALIGNLVSMKYGRDDELESDKLGVRFMAKSGYDPNSMIEVMKILAKAGGEASAPEFFQTHPNPDNRIDQIEEAIKEVYPTGVPVELKE